MLSLKNKLSTLLVYYAGSSVLFLAFSILRLAQLFFLCAKIVLDLMNKIATIMMRQEEYCQSLFRQAMFEPVRSSVLLKLQKSVRAGKRPPDSKLFAFEGKSRHRSLDFFKGSRRYKGPVIWNILPKTSQVLPKIEHFKQTVKRSKKDTELLEKIDFHKACQLTNKNDDFC